MLELFTWLSHVVEGATIVALVAAFIWGVLSVILSPCHLASIPLVVGFISRQGDLSTKKALSISSVFSAGIFVSIAAIGLVTSMAGKVLGDMGSIVNYIVAAVFFVFGLVLLDVFALPWSGTGQPNLKSKGLAAAFILGLVFAIAIGPCTFAFMAPLLGVSLKAGQTDRPMFAFLLMAFYAVGHCGIITFAGTASQFVKRYMDWNQRSGAAVLIKRGCGVVVIICGLYMIYAAR